MDIWRLLGAALRRWYVILVIVTLTAVGAYSMGGRVQPEYTAGSSVLLVPPADISLGNPYADLGTAASSASIVLQSGAVRGDLLSRGLSADYDVAPIPRTPILSFTVRAGDAEVAVATAQALVDEMERELASRQDAAGVPNPLQVTVDVLEPASGATESTRSQLQAQVAVLGLGVVVAFVAAIFYDDILLLWGQRTRRRSGAPSSTSKRRSEPAVTHWDPSHVAVADGLTRHGPLVETADGGVPESSIESAPGRVTSDPSDRTSPVPAVDRDPRPVGGGGVPAGRSGD